MNHRLTTLLALCALTSGHPIGAQCILDWSSNLPQPQLSGSGRCTALWDPDGAGPLPLRLVVGGKNFMAGDRLLGSGLPTSQQVMTWDGNTWEPLGPGPSSSSLDSVDVLLNWNGRLIAGGGFNAPGGLDYIAQWDGTAWRPLDAGFPARVTALATWSGFLVAASYVAVGNLTTPILQLWDGVAWTALPQPPLVGQPTSMVSFRGELIVAGSHSWMSPTLGVIDRWNGTSWAPSIQAQSRIEDLAVRTSLQVGGLDTLIAAGSFSSIGGAAVANLAHTTGERNFAWGGFGPGMPNACSEVLVRNVGLTDFLVVARTSNQTTPMMSYSSRTNAWSSLGNRSVGGIVNFAGSYHGVNFGDPACHRFQGTQWVPVRGPGIAGEVHAVTKCGDDLVIGGNFTTISGVTMNGIAHWDGTTFRPLGSGMAGVSVDALLTLDNGDIIAGGSFATAGGITVNHVARWDGSNWFAMGGGMDLRVRALCKLANGDVIAGGDFTTAGGVPCSRVARWDGASWHAMQFGMNDSVLALHTARDGTVFAGGRFTIASLFSRFRIARWDGTSWGQVGAGFDEAVHGLAERPNGDIIAVGEFRQASLFPVDRIARWDGFFWVSMGAASGDAQPCRSVYVMPNGDVVAGRAFHQPNRSVDSGFSRWNGATWSSMGFLTGKDTLDPIDVRVITQRADGELVLGGNFHVADFTMSHSLATLRSRCMPVAETLGTSCSSSAGPLLLAANTLPWLGGVFQTTTTGLAPGSLCLGAVGFSPVTLPLAALLPQGQPGCFVNASLDIVTLLPTGTGTAHSLLRIANDRALLGVQLFMQSLPLEFDLSGALAAVRGSNALAPRIGTM
jgi:hypothetical protein